MSWNVVLSVIKTVKHSYIQKYPKTTLCCVTIFLVANQAHTFVCWTFGLSRLTGWGLSGLATQSLSVEINVHETRRLKAHFIILRLLLLQVVLVCLFIGILQWLYSKSHSLCTIVSLGVVNVTLSKVSESHHNSCRTARGNFPWQVILQIVAPLSRSWGNHHHWLLHCPPSPKTIHAFEVLRCHVQYALLACHFACAR
jgi:hypothetical protein